MGIGYFIFGNVDSRNYDITVAFKDVDHTPKRVYQRIAMPGRNGEFYLDEKRFEDVPVSYDCIALDDDDRKSFVNALAAQTGHVRLEDTFNVGEFYSAVFEGDVDPYVTQDRENSTFTIQFTRKPQRWLKSGETAVSVSSGGTLTNPTLFEASPILTFRGYGDIALSGQHINVDSVTIGKVLLSNGGRTNVEYYSFPRQPRGMQEVTSYKIDTNSLNTGDDIVLGLSSFTYTVTATYYSDHMIEADATNQIGSGSSTTAKVQTDKTAVFITEFEPITFQNGTAKTVSAKYWLHYKYGDSGSYTDSTNPNTEIRIVYNGSDTITVSAYAEEASGSRSVFGSCVLGTTTGNSTVQASGDITIDLDTGESYWVRNGQKISADYAVRMGASLPTLKPGTNVITYDDTITQFKVTPNWWRL